MSQFRFHPALVLVAAAALHGLSVADSREADTLGGAPAAPDTAPASAGGGEIGAGTRSLLELQRSGRQAGPVLPMLGAAQVLSYQRYIDSHKHPIPTSFGSVVTTGAGGGGK